MPESMKVYSISESVYTRCSKDGSRSVIVNVATGTILMLNRTCTAICGLIKETPREIDEIISWLAKGVDLPENARQDIQKMLDVLVEKGIIE